MGFFDIDEEHLQMIFDEAVRRSGGNISEAERDSEVEQAICVFAQQHNCSYDDAWIIAENPGKKLRETEAGGCSEYSSSGGSYSHILYYRSKK